MVGSHGMRHAQAVLSHVVDVRGPRIDERHVLAGYHMGAGIGPRRCRAAEQRDELTASELVELHSISTSQRRMQDIELHLFHSNISVSFEYCYCPTRREDWKCQQRG